MKDKDKSKDEEKEGFCGLCVAGLGTLLGGGITAGSSKTNKKNKKKIFWLGVSISIISIIVLLYLIFIRGCDDCF